MLCSKAFNQLIYKHPQYYHAMYNIKRKEKERIQAGKERAATHSMSNQESVTYLDYLQ